jgi:hypothetical protein
LNAGIGAGAEEIYLEEDLGLDRPRIAKKK